MSIFTKSLHRARPCRMTIGAFAADIFAWSCSESSPEFHRQLNFKLFKSNCSYAFLLFRSISSYFSEYFLDHNPLRLSSFIFCYEINIQSPSFSPFLHYTPRCDVISLSADLYLSWSSLACTPYKHTRLTNIPTREDQPSEHINILRLLPSASTLRS